MLKQNRAWILIVIGLLLILGLKWRNLGTLPRPNSISHQAKVGKASLLSPDPPSLTAGTFRKQYHENLKLRAYNESLENAIRQSGDQPLKEMLFKINQRMPNTWRDTFVFRDAYNAVSGISALKNIDQSFINSNAEHIKGIGELSGNPETERYLNAINDARKALSAKSLETFRDVMANRLSLKYPEFERGEWIEMLDIDYAAPSAPIGPYNLVSAKDVAFHFGLELLPPSVPEKRGISIDEARRLTEARP